MIVLILKVFETSPGCRNISKKNGVLVVDVMVLSLCKSRSLIGSRSSEIQFFAISNLLTTNSYLRSKLSVKGERSTIIMSCLRYTQEFQLLFMDELSVFLKESSIARNTEEGHVAYSYPKKPCIVFDVFACRLYSQVSWMMCHLVFESILTILVFYMRIVLQNIAQTCESIW